MFLRVILTIITGIFMFASVGCTDHKKNGSNDATEDQSISATEPDSQNKTIKREILDENEDGSELLNDPINVDDSDSTQKSAKPFIEFETAGYYKNDRHRIFAKYPLKTLQVGNIHKDVWDRIVEVGLDEMYTKGRTTRVFFYLDRTSALRARLNQDSSYDAALSGAYYGKPFAAVEIMPFGDKYFTKYPEMEDQEVIKLE